MEFLKPDPTAALLGLRTLKTIASRPGPIGPAQRAMMQASHKMILHIEADIDALPPIEPAELAASFPASEALRRQFTNGMMVIALADGPPQSESIARVAAFTKALGISEPVLDDLRLIAEGHMLVAKLDFLRRGHIADIFKDQMVLRGPLGFAKSVLSMRGVIEEPELAARYRAWEKLPEGTLGRELIDFYNKHGFAVPGERGGFPEAGLYHDFCHLLGGYSTEPEGEIQVASFTAGFKKERPFYVALFAVLIFSSGVQMRPTNEPFVVVAELAKPGVAELMLAAIESGSKLNMDLTDKWDYWAWIHMPIEEVRRKMNILPKG